MVQSLYNNRTVIVMVLAFMLLISNIVANSLLQPNSNVTAEAVLFPSLEEFTYEMHAPDDVKELTNKASYTNPMEFL